MFTGKNNPAHKWERNQTYGMLSKNISVGKYLYHHIVDLVDLVDLRNHLTTHIKQINHFNLRIGFN